MRGLSPAVFICVVFICTVFTGLLGLAQIICPWDPKSPIRIWNSCPRVTQRNFLLSVSYFTAFLIAVFILFSVWLEATSHIAFQLLLELSWLNGLSIEALIICRIFCSIRIYRIIVPIIVAIAGLLQAMGFGVLFYDNDTGIYVAFAGGCLFHVFAAAAVAYLLLNYEIVRHRKLVFIALTYLCAISGCGFIYIGDRDTFLLANCILESCVNVILLLLTQIKGRKEGSRAIAAGEERSLAHSNGKSRHLDVKEITAQ
ncbi:hypothetical protein GQ43DRAFT_100918 [Delitschia confertaspora ATCC 74209]|uniref:Uncharacterized protein n=1 Tax=Delitschia confertaspora ATCC 74209 TaxID=1513339 RepID=A0A9P4MXE5_9PLEO|nr:hypothetical protein GQ43DRAFT_100918 [Delitschia confertaspora ATCC 74209]